MCFRGKIWYTTAKKYTKCIDSTFLQLKELVLNENNYINTSIWHTFPDQAKMWLSLKEFKQVLEDSDETFGFDHNHLKSLYQKCHTLVKLMHYVESCEFLEESD